MGALATHNVFRSAVLRSCAGRWRDLSRSATAGRIASRVPSLTEAIVVPELKPCLFARSRFCIASRDPVREVPPVGKTKNVDLAGLRERQPTHVLLNVDENRRDAVKSLREFVPGIVVTHPCAPADNLALIDQLRGEFGDLPGMTEGAYALHAALLGHP